MSDVRAIAAVTATLKSLLAQGLPANVAALVGEMPAVSALPPDRIEVGDKEKPRLNVFVHQVAHNQGWRNIDARRRDGDGRRVANPMLALDLRYLVSAYGAADLDIEILLGIAGQVFHQQPVLAPAAIQAAMVAAPKLAGCGLDEQVERVRIVPDALGGEEMSRLWSGLQAHARPSLTYVASVVLIESHLPVAAALPVVERRLHVRAMRQPRIDRLERKPTAGAATGPSSEPATVVAGDTLVIRGFNLAATTMGLRFAGQPNLVPADSASDTTVEVAVPAGLAAGVCGVQVVHELELGTPGDPHRGFESNVAAFVLAPRITTDLAAAAPVARGATLTVDVEPPVRLRQRAALLLDERAIEPAAIAAPATALSFTIPADTPVGQPLVRVRVDGAASMLTIDEAPGSPTIGQYNGPRVTIT